MESNNYEKGGKQFSSNNNCNEPQTNTYSLNKPKFVGNEEITFKKDFSSNQPRFTKPKEEVKPTTGFVRQGFIKKEESIVTTPLVVAPKQVLNWKNRYDRSYYYSSNDAKECESLLVEHINHQNKNINFDFEKLMSAEIFIYDELGIVLENTKLETFSELGYDSTLLSNITKMQFDRMTPIQKAVIPTIFNGSDLMGCAQTGSGKTIAFTLPILEKLMKVGPPRILMTPKVSYPVTVILVPTRELVDQIYRVARLISSGTGISIGRVYGGVPHDNQIKDLKNGVDILISTTGRLLDFLKNKLVSLSCVKHLIIDEADRLLEMGFEKQLNEILHMHGK